jgi:hypothetical protein
LIEDLKFSCVIILDRMPTAQSRANLKYYHKRVNEDPEYLKRICENKKERYYLNIDEEREKARNRYYTKKEKIRMLNLPAEKIECEISA